MAIGIGGALLGKGENEKAPPVLEDTHPPAPSSRSGWTLASLIPKTDMRSFMQMPANTVPWNLEPTRFALLQKLCAQHGLARQGELKDLEDRICAGLHWNASQLQTSLQHLYLQQMKDGAMSRMQLAAAFATATSTAAQPVLQPFVPLFSTPAPDPYEGHRDTLLRRLSVRNGLPEAGNTRKLTYQLQRNLGWDDQQLQAKLEIEFHCQKNNTWLPSPKDKVKDEAKETESKEIEDVEKITRADVMGHVNKDAQKDETEDPQWEYLSGNTDSRSQEDHLEQKESDKREPAGTKSEPCNIKSRALQRTFSGSSDSSYEVVDGM